MTMPPPPPPAQPYPVAPPLRPEDEKLWATLTHLSGIFLSFMRPIGTAARMRVDPGSGDRIAITVNGDPLYDNGVEGDTERNFVPLGSLSYRTDNYYWIQQVYWYKMGGVFLEQPNEGISVKVAPAPTSATTSSKSTKRRS